LLNDKKVRENILLQSIIQGANFLFPLIALPYLIRVLGVENYGVYVLAATTAMFFGVLCDYGFNLTGTRDVAAAKKNMGLISTLYSKVMALKIIMSFLSFTTLLILTTLNHSVRENFLLYFFSFTFVIAQSFFPAWLFLGLEDSRIIATLNFISKFIFTASLFIFVNKAGDAYIAAILNTIGALFSTLLALAWLRYKYKIQYSKTPISDLMRYAKDGVLVFLAQLKILLFSSSNIIILGAIAGSEAVGFYSSAEKLMRAVAQIQVPILTAIFPRIASMINENRQKLAYLLKLILLYGCIGYLIVGAIVFIYAPEITTSFFGPNLSPTVSLLRIIILCPTFIFLNNIFGTQILLNLGKDKQYFIVLFVVGLLNLALCTFLSELLGATGASISLLISEGLVALGMYLFSRQIFWRNI